MVFCIKNLTFNATGHTYVLLLFNIHSQLPVKIMIQRVLDILESMGIVMVRQLATVMII